MLVALLRIGVLALLTAVSLHAKEPASLKELKALLAKEKATAVARETKRKETLSKVDQLNQNQNQVRKRLSEIGQSQQELNMAASNLALEIQKQKESEKVSKQRLSMVLKMVYRIHRDGILRFAMAGGDLGSMVKRVRVLYRTLRANSSIAEQMQARSQRLADSERKLADAQSSMLQLSTELREQEGLLGTFLEQKKRVLGQIKTDQQRYEALKDQFQSVQEQVKSLFEGIDKNAAMFVGKQASKASLTFVPPLDNGTIVRRFGKTVHDKFRTVVPHKGVEIEAEHKSPVHAVADGKVEFEGWIKGLGNVVVLQHASSYFTLSAHLFEGAVKTGDTVTQGQIIGSVGDTGTSALPSLYFELRHKGKAIDPLMKFSISSKKQVTRMNLDELAPKAATLAPVLLPNEED